MNVGDLITGVDRTYTRSIYKLICVEPLELEFISFNGYKASPRDNNTIKPKNFIVGYDFETNPLNCKEAHVIPIYGEKVSIRDYRLATEEEIAESCRNGDIPSSEFEV